MKHEDLEDMPEAQIGNAKFVGVPATKPYRPNQGHCSGMLFSYKNNDQRPWRGTLERDSMILLDVNPEVQSFLVEPLTIPYVMPSGKQSHYTPDHLIHYHGSHPSMWVEVKPKRQLLKNRALWKAKFAAATEEAQRRGWEFAVWTEQEIRGPVLENAAFLRGFLQRPPDNGMQRALLTKLEALQATTVKQLLDGVASDALDREHLIPQLWQLIALRRIQANWQEQLTLHSRIQAVEASPR